jgi:ubiquinone/menaquinone biosynthesis C-methylase UbiE
MLPEATIICDVGGGSGHMTLHLIQNFPQLRVILQDRQHVLEDGKKVRFE